MSKRTLTLAILVVVLFLGGWYYGSPYWAVRQMQVAAKASQGDRLARYVDVPAVRESLRPQVQVMWEGQTAAAEMKQNPYTPLARHLAGTMVDTIVDGMVTPEALARMVSSGKADPRAWLPKPSSEASPPPSAEEDEAPSPRVDRHYAGLSVFEVEMHDPRTDKATSTLVLTREGWFGWKLTSVRAMDLIER